MNYRDFENSNLEQKQAVFASIFIIANRLQTACEKIQSEMTMKQWLLISMIVSAEKPKTLTNIGQIMGCSRQNVKKLAEPLADKGFLNFVQGANNALELELTDKVVAYFDSISDRQIKSLDYLFSEFSTDEIEALYNLYEKLFNGLEKVESYGEEIKYEN